MRRLKWQKNLFDVHSQYQSTSTQAVLNKIGSQLRFLSEHSSDAGTAVGDDYSEVVEYEKAVLTLCSQLIHCVDHPEVHNGIYQIVVSGLADKTPSLVVLPCLVDIALVDGVERQNDVNGILTGLLMNVDLHNYQDVINQVPKCLSRLINGITDEKQRQTLQNEFLILVLNSVKNC